MLPEESVMEILRTAGFVVRAICGVHLKDRKRAKDFILMFGFTEAINQFLW